MFSISDFKVEIETTDISAMVTSMNLYESIHGNVKGTIHVEDKLNFFDTFFTKGMTAVKISYAYFGKRTDIDLYADGVIDQVITKTGKSYNIVLSSLLNLNAAVTRICNVYSGTSNDILAKIWLETNGTQPLVFDSTTTSNGKYVVPNISSHECMRKIVNAAYDVNNTGMFLYQRLSDHGATRFTSIHDMIFNPFSPLGVPGVDGAVPFIIRNEEVTLGTTLAVHGMIGTASSFTLKDYNKDFIKKLAGGLWGKKVTEIALDETTNKVHSVIETTGIERTKFSLSKNLYSNIILADGPAGKETSYVQKSLFTPDNEVSQESITNMKFRLFNTNLHVDNVIAIPDLGCGMAILVDQGGNTVSATKTDGAYLVANINHMYVMNDGEMKYSQNIGLVRE